MSTLHDHGFVHRQVAALHDHLAQFEGGTSVDGAERTFGVGEIARIRHALRRGMDNESQHPGGHYYARDPLISLMQSAAHEQLVTQEGQQALEYTDGAGPPARTVAGVRGAAKAVADRRKH